MRAAIGILSGLLVLARINTATAGEPSTPAASSPRRTAVERAVGFLDQKATAWRTAHQCASCHHVPQMVWVQGEAQEHGIAVNDQSFADTVAWLAASDDPAKLLHKKPVHALQSNYGLLALARARRAKPKLAKSPEVPAAMAKLTEFIYEKRLPDGNWAMDEGGRLPLINDQHMVTALTAIALGESAGADETAQQRAFDAMSGARTWLTANPGKGLHQNLVLELWLDRLLGSESAVATGIEQLLARQNSDGGWCQLPEMSSDAFATGQSLYVLRRCGLPPDHLALIRAAEFLVKSQLEDGSWPMLSRHEPGKLGPANEPITCAGIGWGALGLLAVEP